MVRKERLELSMGSFMQRLATNDLVFMYVLRLGVTNVGCQRLLKVADFCPKAVQTLIFLRTDHVCHAWAWVVVKRKQ